MHSRLGWVLSLVTIVACGQDKATEKVAAGSPPPTAEPDSAVAGARRRILTAIGDTASHIEGIATYEGKLFVADWKDGAVYRVDPSAPTPERVGQLPTKPGQSILGIATDSAGNVYAAVPDVGIVYRIDRGRLGANDFSAAKDARPFATRAFGANGINFDRAGHLWITGGDKGALYQVGPNGGKVAVFAKDFSPISTDTTMPVRVYTVNGVALDSKGRVYTVNTGTGEVNRLEVKPGYQAGAIESLVKSPSLLGADGLIIDDQDNLWISCNFLSALAKVTPTGDIQVIAADGPSVPKEARVLRFPAELKRIGNTMYLANLNFPVGANVGSPAGATIAAVELR